MFVDRKLKRKIQILFRKKFPINDILSISRKKFYYNCSCIQFKGICNYDIVKKMNIINIFRDEQIDKL